MSFSKEKLGQVKINMGLNLIKVVNHDIHVDLILSNSQKYVNDAIEEKIIKCKSICYAAQGLGSHRIPVTPMTSSKLYWSMCIPKWCYGLEVLNIDDKSAEMLESFHCSMAKQQQGLPVQCSNTGSLGTIGWKTLESHIDIIQLMFLWQLLLLPFSCIYKQICIQRLCKILYDNVCSSHYGPLLGIIKTCRKYGLLRTVETAIESGTYMSKGKWKKLVKYTVERYDFKRWKILCKLYKSLCSLSLNSPNAQMSAWWVHAFHDPRFARQNIVIIKLLLNVYIYRKKVCPCCDKNCVNTVVPASCAPSSKRETARTHKIGLH